MSVKLSPIFNSQIVDASGNPATGWKIYTYVAGSSTALATYTTSAGNVAQSNPIIIDSLGFPTVGQIWLTAGSTYKLVLTDSNDVVKKTEDNVSGVNDSSISQDEWLDSGVTPTYVSATSFTLVGDQTSAFHVGRRLKSTVTAGTTYSRITASAYGALTTVTVANDGSLTLDSGLSAVQYGILRNNVLSIPFRIATAAGTDTYTASVGATRLVNGDEYKINIASTNTSATPTLNLDSLGAKTIKTQSGGALVAGNLNGEHLFRYNGTDMIVLNPVVIQTAFVPTAANALSGSVIQTIEATPYTTYSSTATAIPFDDTIPQNTEGAEIQTVTITPNNASNRLRIEFDGVFAASTSGMAVSVALFQGSTANALKAAGAFYPDSSDIKSIPLVYEMAAGSTSAITFKIRFGPSANTAYVNGTNAARRFGGVQATTLRVVEIKA